MKKLLVLGALLFSAVVGAQDIVKVDVAHPDSKNVLLKDVKQELLTKKLDSLNGVYNTDKFVLYVEMSDKTIVELEAFLKVMATEEHGF